MMPLAGRQGHLWKEFEDLFPTETELTATALALGACEVEPWSEQETAVARLVHKALPLNIRTLRTLRDLIHAGYDPLGEAFCTLRSPADRRIDGATYTPVPIVRAMVDWAASHKTPERIIDPGTGSARFLMQAGKTFSEAVLIGIETDPVAALLARANLAVMGLARRSRIIVGDYRRFHEPVSAPSLYIGNPPYVRHHLIGAKWKKWLSEEAAKHGHKASQPACGSSCSLFPSDSDRRAGGRFWRLYHSCRMARCELRFPCPLTSSQRTRGAQHHGSRTDS